MSESELDVDVLVIGCGPTGLGAAHRLKQQNIKDWLIIDQNEKPAGLACTVTTDEGFLFDMGGHVIFSHYKYFDDLLQDAVGSFTSTDNWVEHQRVSYVRLRNNWVPYPFQNNLCFLPVEDQIKCINGLVDARVKAATNSTTPTSFDEWIIHAMGEGIANIFMRPYNFKVWAVPTTAMQCKWLGERVAVVDTERAISNVLRKQEDSGWGPNATFRFPVNGGTGGIWNAVYDLLPKEKTKLGWKVLYVNAIEKYALVEVVSNGAKMKINYDSLVSTLPLDICLRNLKGITEQEKEKCDEWASNLSFSSTHVIGLGFRGENPHDKKCWLYFPEDNCPFYRVTVFSHYAPGNVPHESELLQTKRCIDPSLPFDSTEKGGPWWSLMFEVSESSKYKPVDMQTIVEEVIQGSLATALTRKTDEIVSIFHRRLEYGYPTPSLKRDEVLEEALPWLKKHRIWSRGRFGSYKYEVANQDHSVALGVEAIDNIKKDLPETTLMHPSIVNKKGTKNEHLVYGM